MKPSLVLFSLVALNVTPSSAAPGKTFQESYLREVLGISSSSLECTEALESVPFDRNIPDFLRKLRKATFSQTCALFEGRKPDLSALEIISTACTSPGFSLDNFIQAPCERDKQNNLCLLHYASWEESISPESSDDELRKYLALACPHDCRVYLVGYAAEVVKYKIDNNMPTELEPHNLCSGPDGWVVLDPPKESEESVRNSPSASEGPVQDPSIESEERVQDPSIESEERVQDSSKVSEKGESSKSTESIDDLDDCRRNVRRCGTPSPPKDLEEKIQERLRKMKERENCRGEKKCESSEESHAHVKAALSADKKPDNRDKDEQKDRERHDKDKDSHSKEASNNEDEGHSTLRVDEENKLVRNNNQKSDEDSEKRSVKYSKTQHATGIEKDSHVPKDGVVAHEGNHVPTDEIVAPASDAQDGKKEPEVNDTTNNSTKLEPTPSPSLAGTGKYASAISAVVLTMAVMTLPLLS